jgi:hypothetical protein
VKLGKMKSLPSKDTLQDCLTDPYMAGYIQRYDQFQQEMAHIECGKTS